MALQLYGNKLIHHLDMLAKWKNNQMFPPASIEVGPVIGCNHRCVNCYIQGIIKKRVMMKEDVYFRFMKEIGEYGVKAIVLAGCGETLLHKATPKAIEIARKNGTDVGMFTNGIFLSDDNIPLLLNNLTYMRLTINGGSERSYTKLHRCSPNDWRRIKENMKKIVAYKEKSNSKCTLGVYTLIHNDSILELENWVKEIKEMGFDYIIIRPVGPSVDHVEYVAPVKIEAHEPMLRRIPEMSDANFVVQMRWDLINYGCVRNYKRCLGLPFMCSVDADGSVIACNRFWGDESFKYGDLNKNTFKEIWESERKAEIIEIVSSEDFDLSLCGECRQNSINHLLFELANPPDHINFV